MGYPKIELPRNGQYIHLNEPKVYHDEITQTYKCVNKVSVQIYQMAETHIVQAIIDYAKEQGITDLFLIDEDFVKSALLNEKARREKLKLKLQSNFDKITSSVESLAEFFVEESKQEDYKGEYSYWGCGEVGETYDKQEAIKSTIEWLQQECNEE